MMLGLGWLRHDWRSWLLVGSLVTCAVAAVLIPALPQPVAYHAFADSRSFGSVPNFLNVASNLPFFVGGALGSALISRGGGRSAEPRESLPYLAFFVGALL